MAVLIVLMNLCVLNDVITLTCFSCVTHTDSLGSETSGHRGMAVRV
jgi:hypothetical protein